MAEGLGRSSWRARTDRIVMVGSTGRAFVVRTYATYGPTHTLDGDTVRLAEMCLTTSGRRAASTICGRHDRRIGCI